MFSIFVRIFQLYNLYTIVYKLNTCCIPCIYFLQQSCTTCIYNISIEPPMPPTFRNRFRVSVIWVHVGQRFAVISFAAKQPKSPKVPFVVLGHTLISFSICWLFARCVLCSTLFDMLFTIIIQCLFRILGNFISVCCGRGAHDARDQHCGSHIPGYILDA